MSKWLLFVLMFVLSCFIVVLAQADVSLFENHSISNIPTAAEPVPYSFTLNSQNINPNTISVKIIDHNNFDNPFLLTETLHYIVTPIPYDFYRITILPTVLTLPGLAMPRGFREDYNYQAEYTTVDPLLDIFGMAVGNKWKYEGTYLGQPLSVEENITEIDPNSFSVPVLVSKIKENGIYAGTDYYENEGDQLKLWGLTFKDEGEVFYLSFSQGLVVAWVPLNVGDDYYSEAIVTFAQYPGYPFNASLTADVESIETVILDFAPFQAYKVNYTLEMWGYDLYESVSYSLWIVPYLGVVKDESAEGSSKLTSFSIGGGIITEKSDADNDGLIDFLELTVCETNWQNPDTDDDGLLDGIEDANHNGIIDPGETDPLDSDSDDDGFTDQEEVICGSDPRDSTSRCRVGLPWLMLLLGN